MRFMMLGLCLAAAALATACGGDSDAAPAGTTTRTTTLVATSTPTAAVAQASVIAATATATPPAATATASQGTTATLTPNALIPGIPTFSRPPAAQASAGGISVTAGIGSYCWTNLCADTMGPVTGPQALETAAGASVTLAIQFTPTAASVSALPGTSQPQTSSTGELLWNFPPFGGEQLAVTIGANSVVFSAPSTPGRYVVTAFLQVPGGDVLYGVLIEVR